MAVYDFRKGKVLKETSLQLFIGFMSGLLAAFVAIASQWGFRRLQIWWHYRGIKGDYLGYGYESNTNPILSDKPQSRAEVKKIRRNCFKITVDHGSGPGDMNYTARWEGTLTMHMDLDNFGTVSWIYTKLPQNAPEGTLLFGFKRCTIDLRARRILLMGEGGYGIEVFKPVNKNEA